MHEDPPMEIHRVVSDLKNKVDLKREKLKLKIDNNALALIEQFDEFKKKCLDNYYKINEHLTRFSSNKQISKSLKAFEDSCASWKHEFGFFLSLVLSWAVRSSNQPWNVSKDFNNQTTKFTTSVSLLIYLISFDSINFELY